MSATVKGEGPAIRAFSPCAGVIVPRPSSCLLLFVSEFYSIRRDNITDVTALFGFLAGFIGAGPYAYSFIRVGFETAAIVKGFALFITVTMGAGVLVAIAGLGVGRGLGWFWERGHRLVRHSRGQEFAEGDGTTSPANPRFDHVAAVPLFRPPVDEGAPAITYREGFDARAFAALIARAGIAELDVSRTAAALERTKNVGAWDGTRLVGAVRLLTDGYTWSVVTDIVVDPPYRRHGIGRELMARAADVSSGSVSIARVPPGTEGFFRQLDVLPPYRGFVRGAKSRLQ
ncbi:MAG TPA: GNAT family N-acetyltransferase [Gemmatimonadaceae bacterium]